MLFFSALFALGLIAFFVYIFFVIPSSLKQIKHLRNEVEQLERLYLLLKGRVDHLQQSQNSTLPVRSEKQNLSDDAPLAAATPSSERLVQELSLETSSVVQRVTPQHDTPVSQAANENTNVAAFTSEPQTVSNAKAASSAYVNPSWQAYSNALPPPANTISEATKNDMEFQFGAKLPVWIGAIALIFAGIYLVKYSIDVGFLNPLNRLIILAFFSLGLVFSGNVVARKTGFANGERISQALIGAGIAGLYACVVTATKLYDFLPEIVGFLLVAAITALAFFQAIRFGSGIAFLGLAGGVLAPLMIDAYQDNAALVFGYLFILVGASLELAKRKGWSILAILLVSVSFLWVFHWIAHTINPSDGMVLSLFLVLLVAMVGYQNKNNLIENNVSGSQDLADTVRANDFNLLQHITTLGALCLMVFVVSHSHFGLFEIGMFAVLSIACFFLAGRNYDVYGKAVWAALIASVIILFAWKPLSPLMMTIFTFAFALLFVVGGFVYSTYKKNSAAWGGLSALASFSFYFLYYYYIEKILPHSLINGVPVSQLENFNGLPSYLSWSAIAFMLCVAYGFATRHIYRTVGEDKTSRDGLLAIYSLTTTAYLSLAVVLQLPLKYIMLAFAMQMFATSWVYNRFNIKILRDVIGGLAVIYLLLLTPYFVTGFFNHTYYVSQKGLFYILSVYDNLPFVDNPVLFLIVPGALFLGSAWLLAKRDDNDLVKFLEKVAIGLFAISVYYLSQSFAKSVLSFTQLHQNFLLHSIINAALMAFSVIVIRFAKLYQRPNIARAAGLVLAVTIAKIILLDVLFENPLFHYQSVGSWPLFNGLLLSYAMPMFVIYYSYKQLSDLPFVSRISMPILLTAAAFGFIWLNMSVKQLFHGAFINHTSTSTAELYAYSASWIIVALGLLVMGTYKNDKVLRFSSLGLMIISIGKVFLIDAAALTGLYRVFSFLGLGVALISLSWFYSKFVFTHEKLQPPASTQP